MTTPFTPAAETRRPGAGQGNFSLLATTVYIATSFPLAILFFVTFITLFSVGFGTAILIFGLPVLAAALGIARGAAAIERRMLEGTLELDAPAPSYATGEEGKPLGLLQLFRDPQSWADAGWIFINFFLSTIAFSLMVLWWGGAIGIVVGPISQIVVRLATDGDSSGAFSSFMGGGLILDIVLFVVLGIGFALTLRPVLRVIASVQATVSYTLLCSRAEDQARREHLESSREAVQTQENAGLRRIERDIHDGPQQRLIRLQMDLARAERLADSDPERAREILGDARLQTQSTLDELRHLSRGIAPPILVDRGLEAAVEDAARCSDVPFSTDLAVPVGLPDLTQTVAYFVVSEAIANANKHSRASEGTVTITHNAGELLIEIADDGEGGAATAKGHGLAGLADRLSGVDGRLLVVSPIGGPTMISAIIPCASS